jgi:hypothetical protein
MRRSTIMPGVLRAALIFLGAILIFGVVFSLVPGGPPLASSGATLRDVRLTLYPQQDPNAEWRFRARTVQVDPEAGENSLGGLERGERWVRAQKGAQAGQLVLDLTMQSSALTIDRNDNLKTSAAVLYFPADCLTLTLKGRGQTPIVINQQSGFSAPYARISSPSINVEYDNITSDFAFSNTQGEQRRQGQDAGFDPSPDQRCVGGKLVKRVAATRPPARPG